MLIDYRTFYKLTRFNNLKNLLNLKQKAAKSLAKDFFIYFSA